MSLVVRKPVFRVSDQVQYKPGCTAIEDGLRLQNSNFGGSRGIYHLYSENKGADQLRGYREADLRLCFHICKKPIFSQQGSNTPIRDLLLHTAIFLSSQTDRPKANIIYQSDQGLHCLPFHRSASFEGI